LSLTKNSWSLAIEALSWIELRGFTVSHALSKACGQLNVTDYRAMGFAHRLIIETLRRKNTIDTILNIILSPAKLEDHKLGIQSFLRLYVYKTRFSDQFNINDSINIVNVGRAVLGWRNLQKIEPVLGKILTFQIDKYLNGLNDKEKIGLKTYHPTWFINYCFRLFGRRIALKFLEKNNQPTPTYIRINSLKGNENKIVDEIEKEGVKLKKELGLKGLYRVLDFKKPLIKTNAYHNGLFKIQDKANYLTVESANLQKDMIVLDVCAAPGMNTTQIAQLVGSGGEVLSVDLSSGRMKILKNELKRLGIKNVHLFVADATKNLPIRTEADAVILDPPCSNTGMFGNRPSVKWRIEARDIQKLADIQLRILGVCAGYVKIGGNLVYMTHSITLEENENIIERFLRLNPNFRIEKINGIGANGLRGLEACRRLYPHLHDSSGAFICKIRRTS
jgi:16S rRNA (cytosine967-C5)-methyltransferase